MIDDRTGFKIKNTWSRKEWTGNTVRRESWEERHPQDLIRSVQDRQDVDDPNPEASDTFLSNRSFRITRAVEDALGNSSDLNFRIDASGNRRIVSGTDTLTKASDL